MIGVLVLCLSACAWGEEVNTDKAGAAAPPATTATTPAAGTTEKPAVKNLALDRTIADIAAQVAASEKLLKSCEEEMAKPEDKRDVKKAQNLKVNAALGYYRAAAKAKGFSLRLKDDEKQSFLDQYDKPNREKAVSLLLELADAAKGKKSYQEALSLYKQVLGIEPKNAAAEAGIKAITEELKTAKATGSGSAGSGTDNTTTVKPWEQGYKKDYGAKHTDWGRTGRGAW
jgi:tetratricopeptide (TPR) repeat protein